MIRSRFSVLLLLSLFAGHAAAAMHVDVLVFTQPGATGDTLPWKSELPLPPCHAVQLREGSGAEAAYINDSECVKKKGYEAIYAGYGATGASTLPGLNKLKNAGHNVLVNRGWRQTSGGLSPVLLRGGPDVGGRPQVVGTLEYTAAEKYVEVKLEFVLTRLNEGQPEYLVISETRKMKYGEPHYLDHPLLGAIVQVDDLTPKDGKTAPAAAP